MPPKALAESVVEDAALEWLEAQGCGGLHGPRTAFVDPASERADPALRDVDREGRLRDALLPGLLPASCTSARPNDWEVQSRDQTR